MTSGQTRALAARVARSESGRKSRLSVVVKGPAALQMRSALFCVMATGTAAAPDPDAAAASDAAGGVAPV
jgi:hypothetical protein